MKNIYNDNVRVYFVRGYGNEIKAGVVIGEEHNGKTWGEIEKLKAKKGYKPAVHYVIDLNYLTKKLEKEIIENGYTTSITSRQKYPRLTFNIK